MPSSADNPALEAAYRQGLVEGFGIPEEEIDDIPPDLMASLRREMLTNDGEIGLRVRRAVRGADDIDDSLFAEDIDIDRKAHRRGGAGESTKPLKVCSKQVEAARVYIKRSQESDKWLHEWTKKVKADLAEAKAEWEVVKKELEEKKINTTRIAVIAPYGVTRAFRTEHPELFERWDNARLKLLSAERRGSELPDEVSYNDGRKDRGRRLLNKAEHPTETHNTRSFWKDNPFKCSECDRAHEQPEYIV